MTFYIKPPEGNLSLKKLHQDAEIRLQFLHQVHLRLDDNYRMDKIFLDHPNIALHSECLIDSSMRDRISHFMLRLASLKNRKFQRFLIETETALFKSRVVSGQQATLKQSLTNLKRHTLYALRHQLLSFHHRELLQQIHGMVVQVLTSGMLECQNRSSCHHIINVPWTMVNSMVSDRSVIVVGGKVDVHCHLLMQLLCSLFEDVLSFGIKELSSISRNQALDVNDPRMDAVKKSLVNTFWKFGGTNKLVIPRSLTYKNIENESQFFPLCMQQLHRILSTTNRLRHHARLRYTLFLKDIGLPVTENIAFWEQYYSKPYVGTASSCNHSWDGNSGKRYIYSVRHVYGLEGGRINYTSHSCASLQALNPQPSEMGGCPFTSDYEEVLSTLKMFYNNKFLIEKILEQVAEGKPNAACKQLLMSSLLLKEQSTPIEGNIDCSDHKRALLQSKDCNEMCNGKQVSKRHVKHNSVDAVLKYNEVYELHSEKNLSNNKYRVGSFENKHDECCKKRISSQYKLKDGRNHGKSHLSSNSYGIRTNKSKSTIDSMLSRNKDSCVSPSLTCENCFEYISECCCLNDNKKFSSCTSCYHSADSTTAERDSCSSLDNTEHSNSLLCDIEDSDYFLSHCNFVRPSEYYLQAKNNLGMRANEKGKVSAGVDKSLRRGK